MEWLDEDKKLMNEGVQSKNPILVRNKFGEFHYIRTQKECGYFARQLTTRELCWDRDGGSKIKTIRCAGLGCPFAVCFEKKKEGWVVASASTNLVHSEACTASRAVRLEAVLANDEVMSQLLQNGSRPPKTISFQQVTVLVQRAAGVVLTKHHVSALFKRIEEHNDKLFAKKLARLWPLLLHMTDASPQFGARVEAISPTGIKVLKTFGVLRPSSSTGRAPSTFKNVDNAQLAYVTVVWPWAVDALEGSPPVYGLDVCHGSGSTGNIAQLSCRMAGTYVPLVTQWQGVENADGYNVVLDAFLMGVPGVRELNFSIISDRCKGLAKSLREWTDKNGLHAQQLFDKPHIWRNVVARFKALQDIPDALSLVKAVLYAPSLQAFHDAGEKLDLAYEKLRPSAATTAALAAAEQNQGDGGEDEDDIAENGWAFPKHVPGSLEDMPEEADSADTPFKYIKLIPEARFLPWKMRYSDHGISSSNSTEAAGSWLRSWGVRSSTPTEGIITIGNEVRRLLADSLKKIDTASKQGQVALRCWPFWERGDGAYYARDNLQITKTSETTAQASDLKFPARSTKVKIAPQVVVDALRAGKKEHSAAATLATLEAAALHERGTTPWSGPAWYTSATEGGFYCSTPCAGPQRFGFACPHLLAAIPVLIEKHSKQSARDAIVSAHAPWYRIETLIKVLSRPSFANFSPPQLADLQADGKLKPIVQGRLKVLVDLDEQGGQPADDARVASAGEGAEQRASRSKRVGGERVSYNCGKCGEPGHNQRTCKRQMGAAQAGTQQPFPGAAATAAASSSASAVSGTSAATTAPVSEAPDVD